MAKRKHIWLTRPAEDNAALAQVLSAQDIPSIIAPVLRIEPLAAPHSLRADAVLLTSRHAAHALAYLPKNLSVYCVGDATATAAKAQGFTHVIAGTGDVLALLPQLVATLAKESHLLYPCGEETRVDVKTLLSAQGIHVTPTIAYRAVAIENIPQSLRDIWPQMQGVSFFSPRSAKRAIQLLHEAGLSTEGIEAYCLSLAVAEAAAGTAWQRVHACAIPTQEAMGNLIVSRYRQAVL